MNISDLVEAATRIAEEHGFTDATVGEDIALMHAELSEALEAFRDPHTGDVSQTWYTDANGVRWPVQIVKGEICKPEGVPSELADTVLRIAHFCGKHRINLAEVIGQKLDYNRTRPQRHGGKRL